MVVCSKSCKVLAKSMMFRAFSRNEALLATFSLKIHGNAKTSNFVRKVAKSWPNWWFFVLFHGTSSFLQLFAAMFIETSKHGSFLGKLQVDKIDDFSCFSTEWGTFCNFLLKSSWKCQDMLVCSKSCKLWPNRWFLVLFHEMRHFLQLFPEKFTEMQRHGSLFEKLQRFGKMDDFSCFFTKWSTFCNFFLKSSSKWKDNFIEMQIDDFSCFFTKWGTFCNFFLVCSRSCKVLAKWMIFRAFSWIEQHFATFCWKVHLKPKTW